MTSIFRICGNFSKWIPVLAEMTDGTAIIEAANVQDATQIFLRFVTLCQHEMLPGLVGIEVAPDSVGSICFGSGTTHVTCIDTVCYRVPVAAPES